MKHVGRPCRDINKKYQKYDQSSGHNTKTKIVKVLIFARIKKGCVGDFSLLPRKPPKQILRSVESAKHSTKKRVKLKERGFFVLLLSVKSASY